MCNVVVGGGGLEAAESVSSIDIVSAPGLSVWSLVSGSGALQTVFTPPSGPGSAFIMIITNKLV